MESLIAEIKFIGFDEITKQVKEKTKLKENLENEVQRLSYELKQLKEEKEINFSELVLAKGELQKLRVVDHVRIFSYIENDHRGKTYRFNCPSLTRKGHKCKIQIHIDAK
jgi:hypothetical protein